MNVEIEKASLGGGGGCLEKELIEGFGGHDPPEGKGKPERLTSLGGGGIG